MASFPKDRFDDLPPDLNRVGAHRAVPKKGRGWIGFAWAALASGVLVLGGLLGIAYLGNVDLGLFPARPTPTPTSTPTPTAEPITDPATIAPERGISITVLNGSGDAAAQADAVAKLAGWPVGFVTQAATSDVEDTTVYYSDPLNEDVARGIVLALGVGDIRLIPVEQMPSAAPIVLVIGLDYPVPAAGRSSAQTAESTRQGRATSRLCYMHVKFSRFRPSDALPPLVAGHCSATICNESKLLKYTRHAVDSERKTRSKRHRLQTVSSTAGSRHGDWNRQVVQR